jgi:rhamnogalacturonyl hydrolase YesR
MKEPLILILIASVIAVHDAFSQNTGQKVNDTNTPLHALQPDYPVPYGPPDTGQVTQVIGKVFNYINASTPPLLRDSKNGEIISDLSKLNDNTSFESGKFRLISYEWGVVYSGMLVAAEATGDNKYRDYALARMNLIGKVADHFRNRGNAEIIEKSPVRSVIFPRALDDAGSMCAAMIKSYEITGDKNLTPCIKTYIDYISGDQLRLNDGTLARNRPLPNSLWLDDLYMSVPALGQMGKLTGNSDYFDDACRQIIQFSGRMFNKDKGLFMHGWIEGMEPHPQFFWGRCNGWAILAMTELLDVLPANHPMRNEILDQYRRHAEGIIRYQSGSGFWHQLIDRNDSYLETSATAIFTYCIAHGINKGWLDPRAFGPSAVLGWNAVQTKVNEEGQVEGTCVGTGMAFDPAFYYHRPVNVAAAHGYGPVILAAAEIIKLTENYQIVINDSAVMFYKKGTDWSSNK